MSAAFDAAGLGRGTPEAAGIDPDLLEEHRQRIHEHQRSGGAFHGSAECVVHDSKVIYFDLCGYAHPEIGNRMTETTLCRGYSMMKPITATAFMTLVEDGLVRLDDQVSKYLPKFSSLTVRKKSGKGVERLKRQMTLRHLVMHTSGIGYGPGAPGPGLPIRATTPEQKMYKDLGLRMDSGEVDTLQKFCDALCEKPLCFQPGSDWQYGWSFDVLARVMEIAAKRSLREIIQDRVLNPTGMLDSTWDVPRSAASKVCGYYRVMKSPGSNGRWLERLDGTRPQDSVCIRGSPGYYGHRVPTGGGHWGIHRTGLLFSLRDVALFCQMFVNGGFSTSGRQVLHPSTARYTLRDWLKMKRVVDNPRPKGFEAGAETGWNPLGHVTLSGPHKGAILMGGMSYFWFDPRHKIITATMGDCWWHAQPLGWKSKTDEMESVVQRAMKISAGKKKKKEAAKVEEEKEAAKQTKKEGSCPKDCSKQQACTNKRKTVNDVAGEAKRSCTC